LKRVATLSGDTLGLPPEQILLQWANIHLRNSGYNKAVMNFGGDLKDGEVLIRLLHQLAPNECSLDLLNITDPLERAKRILAIAEKLGCRKFITEEDIIKGNGRLNVAFLATLFTAYPDMGEKSRVRALEAEVSALNSEVQTLKVDLDGSRRQVQVMRGENMVLQTEVEGLRSQADLMQADQQAASSEFTVATQKILADTRKTMEDMQAQQQAELKRIHDEANARHLAEIAELNAKHEASLNMMRSTFQNELEREKSESGKAIGELQRILAEAIEREKRIKMSIVSEDMQGFLYKKGKKSGNKMQKRLFCMRGEYIMYYKDSHDMSKPAGSIYIITLHKVRSQSPPSIFLFLF
jgi:regulator of replication initiation timing